MSEFVILLPVYLLLTLGFIYLAEVAVLSGKTREGSWLSATKPGDQSERGAGGGELSASLFYQFAGRLELGELSEESPQTEIVEDILYPPPRPADVTVTDARATGLTDIDLDAPVNDFETVIIERAGTEAPAPVLRDPVVLQALEDHLKGWYETTESSANYTYDPKYLTLHRTGIQTSPTFSKSRSLGRTPMVRKLKGDRDEPLAPDLINKLQDGQAPYPGYPKFAEFPTDLMVPK